MSWLSEIENEATLALEGNEAFTEGYMDDLRVARVIREQSAYINASRAVEQCQAKHSSLEMIELINNRLEAEQNLSPDAKEVINESTAPSST